jgi:hypothetical protein
MNTREKGRGREAGLRLEVVVVFPVGHLDQRVGEVGLARLLFHEPDFMEALPADAAAQVSVELEEAD